MNRLEKKIYNTSIVVCIISALLVVLTGCEQTRKNETVVDSQGTVWEVIEIDSCEYIYMHSAFGNGHAGFLSHKGNCKYCEQRRKNK